jgi:hypothetical protein
MAIATGTAIALAAGIGAGTQVAGSVIGSKAAKKASQQQQQAAQQAIAYAEPRYQQALQIAQQQAELGRAGLQPFVNQGLQGLGAGQGGLTALTSFLGLPARANAGMAGTAGGMNRAGMPPSNPNAAAFGNLAQGALGAGAAMVPGGNLQRPTVMLRAPTGQVQAVPADQADFYLARGAQRV